MQEIEHDGMDEVDYGGEYVHEYDRQIREQASGFLHGLRSTLEVMCFGSALTESPIHTSNSSVEEEFSMPQDVYMEATVIPPTGRRRGDLGEAILTALSVDASDVYEEYKGIYSLQVLTGK
jgi:hypothetical protein